MSSKRLGCGGVSLCHCSSSSKPYSTLYLQAPPPWPLFSSYSLLIIPHMLSLSLSALGGEQGGGGSIDPWKCSFQLDGNSSPPPPPSCGFHAPSQSDLEGVNEWMNKWMDE
uniref:Uncharacterized protein n=1 Tax=Physcomitrium patens TaxID=3218 RepID=A0A2K1K4K0_PHYPA|nr:hypothetical protein PHYPA_013171 [Physcomitrium patens]